MSVIFSASLAPRMDGLPPKPPRAIPWGRAIQVYRVVSFIYGAGRAFQRAGEEVAREDLTDEQKAEKISQIVEPFLNSRFRGLPVDEQKEWSGEGVPVGGAQATGTVVANWKRDP